MELFHGTDLWTRHAILLDAAADHTRLLLVRRYDSHVHRRHPDIHQLLVELDQPLCFARIDPRGVEGSAATVCLHRPEENRRIPRAELFLRKQWVHRSQTIVLDLRVVQDLNGKDGEIRVRGIVRGRDTKG